MDDTTDLATVGTGGEWLDDPEPVRDFVALANTEGFRPSSIEQGRGVLIRYNQCLRECFNLDLSAAGWKEFVAYKAHLAQAGIARTTVRGYLSYIMAFYRVRAQASQDPQLLELFTRLRAVGLPRKAKSVKWTPFVPEVLTKILDAAKGQAFVGEGFRAVRSED